MCTFNLGLRSTIWSRMPKVIIPKSHESLHGTCWQTVKLKHPCVYVSTSMYVYACMCMQLGFISKYHQSALPLAPCSGFASNSACRSGIKHRSTVYNFPLIPVMTCIFLDNHQIFICSFPAFEVHLDGIALLRLCHGPNHYTTTTNYCMGFSSLSGIQASPYVTQGLLLGQTEVHHSWM